MSETLTLEEIKTRYPSEWVLIGEPQTDDSLEVVAGEVLSHSLDRDEVDRKLLELRPTRFALRYLGTMPDNMAIVL
jgi:hypothetical protein